MTPSPFLPSALPVVLRAAVRCAWRRGRHFGRGPLREGRVGHREARREPPHRARFARLVAPHAPSFSRPGAPGGLSVVMVLGMVGIVVRHRGCAEDVLTCQCAIGQCGLRQRGAAMIREASSQKSGLSWRRGFKRTKFTG